MPRQQRQVAHNVTNTAASRRGLSPAADAAFRILVLPRIVPADGAALFEFVSSSNAPRRRPDGGQMDASAGGLLLLRLLQLSDLSIDSIVVFPIFRSSWFEEVFVVLSSPFFTLAFWVQIQVASRSSAPCSLFWGRRRCFTWVLK